MRFKRILPALVAGATLGLAGAAMAQGYPSKSITIINPFPPGGLIEQAIRPLANSLQPILGQPVVLENRPGAAGAVGAQVVANAPSDGYTLLGHIVSISIFPEIDKLFDRTPNYTLDDFVPIARVNADPPILIVNAEEPWQSVKELLDDAHDRPNEILFSSSGPYGALHVPMEMLLKAAGSPQLRHLPTTGGGPAITAVLGNNAQALAAGVATASPHIKAGTVRPLAVFGDKRLAAFPDVPTLKEEGYDVAFYVWIGLFAPSGTPQEAVTVLREAVAKAVETDSFREAFANQGLEIAYMDQPEFADFWAKDAAMIADVIRGIGRIEGN